MAGRSSNLIVGVIRGRVGSVVGYKRSGDSVDPQGVKAFVAPSNPKTLAQAQQRAKFAGANVFAGIVSKISDHNVQGQKIGTKNRAKYVQLLLDQCGLVAAKGSSVVGIAPQYDNGIILAKGDLSTLNVNGNGYGLDATPLTAALMETLGIQAGDIITVVRLTGTVVTSGSSSAYANISKADYAQIVAAVGATIPNANIDQTGYVSVAMPDNASDGAAAIIIERVVDGEHHLSTSWSTTAPKFTLEQMEALWATYMTNEAGVRNDKFLYGDELA